MDSIHDMHLYTHCSTGPLHDSPCTEYLGNGDDTSGRYEHPCDCLAHHSTTVQLKMCCAQVATVPLINSESLDVISQIINDWDLPILFDYMAGVDLAHLHLIGECKQGP